MVLARCELWGYVPPGYRNDNAADALAVTHHAPPELLAEAGFASPDHPVTDEMIDHPLDHNRNATDAAAGRTGRAPGTRPDGGPRE